MGQQDVVGAARHPRRFLNRATLPVAASLALIVACRDANTPEQRLRETLADQTTGVVILPAGRIEISSELKLAEDAHDLEIRGAGTVLAAADDFDGRAILVIENAERVTLAGFGVDGNRERLAEPFEMAPPENAFRNWYRLNGVLADQVAGLEIADASFTNVVSFPILIGRSRNIRIHGVTVEDSGSTNALGRNNLSGGILIEEGSSDFDVRESTFRRIAGNGLWTHSLLTTARLYDGVLARNRFEEIGRDAIQVGHATRIRVAYNSGEHIGYPFEVVDVENDGTPVAIDTAGDVDHSVYTTNQFEEINGKCIDLDGFHDGVVRGNTCKNSGAAGDYPHGHFGIVMNNTNPRADSSNISITGNTIDGAKFGGLFVMGRGNLVENNRFLNLNRAGCNESAAEFGCIYKADEPDMLRSGIYLGQGNVRLQQTSGNIIRGNQVGGHGMGRFCIVAGPGVERAANTIEDNICPVTPE